MIQRSNPRGSNAYVLYYKTRYSGNRKKSEHKLLLSMVFFSVPLEFNSEELETKVTAMH